MTLKEFKAFTKHKQYRIILHSGVFLCQRTLSSMKAQLFQVGNFYLEAFYRLPSGEMSFMKIYENTDALEPYLQSIDLQDLLSHKDA
jgi:hypothetical protein